MEKFFQTVGSIDEEELILCLSQIGYEFTEMLSIGALCRTVFKMIQMKKEEEIRMQWTVMLPFMSLGLLKYMSFEEYLQKCTGKNIDLRATNDILNDVAEIRKEIERREKK